MSGLTLDEVDAAIDRYYAGTEESGERATGGYLHIVLDDRNWQRENVEFCRAEALAAHDAEGVALADMLLALSDDDRCHVLGVRVP